VLAAAGLNRIGREHAITELISVVDMAPAPGQGALAVETRTTLLESDPVVRRAFSDLEDPATSLSVLAERALLSRLEAGCAAPVGTHATVSDGLLSLHAVVARPDGSEQLRHQQSVEVADTSTAEAIALGEAVADHFLSLGAASFI
jgi:hydroxymethylbilane synthase